METCRTTSPSGGRPSLDTEDDLPPAPVGLTVAHPSLDDDPAAPIGEAGGPPPPPALEPDPPTGSLAERTALRLDRASRPGAPQVAATDVRQGLHYQQLRDRFPVLDGRSELVDELLDLYTSAQPVRAADDRQQDRRGAARCRHSSAVFRLALAACLLPASRLNGYPGSRGLASHQRRPCSPAGLALPARGRTCGGCSRRRSHDVRTAHRPRWAGIGARRASPRTWTSWAGWARPTCSGSVAGRR